MDIKGIVNLTKNFEYKTANPKFYNIIGSMTYGSSLLKLIHPNDYEILKNDIASLENNDVVTSIVRLNTEKYGYRWFYITTVPASGGEVKYSMELLDIDELVKAADKQGFDILNYRALLSSEDIVYFDYKLDTDAMRLFKISSERTFVVFNDKLDVWSDDMISRNNMQGGGIQRINKLCDDLRHVKHISEVMQIAGKDNETAYISIVGTPVCMDDGVTRTNVLGRIVKSDSSGLSKAENNKYDDLTGLLTKNSIRSFAEKSIYENKDKLCCIVILDIDNFKAVNDTYGHLFGDEVIVRIANIITGIVGKQGVVGRFGGDEFFIVLDGVNDNAEVRSILRSIRMNVYETRFENNPSAVVSCSIGSAVYPINGGSFDIIFKKADKALYLAKEKGRNRYIIYEEAIHGEIEEEMMIKKPKKDSIDINKNVFSLAAAINKITDVIMRDGIKSVGAMIDYISEMCEVRRINVYYGSDFEKIYTCGDTECSEFSYADEDYFKLFNDFGVLVMNFTYKLEYQHDAAYKSLKDQNVCSAIQCIIGSKDDVKGVVSFENCTYDKMFSQNDTLIFAFFANLLKLVLDENGSV